MHPQRDFYKTFLDMYLSTQTNIKDTSLSTSKNPIIFWAVLSPPLLSGKSHCDKVNAVLDLSKNRKKPNSGYSVRERRHVCSLLPQLFIYQAYSCLILAAPYKRRSHRQYSAVSLTHSNYITLYSAICIKYFI